MRATIRLYAKQTRFPADRQRCETPGKTYEQIHGGCSQEGKIFPAKRRIFNRQRLPGTFTFTQSSAHGSGLHFPENQMVQKHTPSTFTRVRIFTVPSHCMLQLLGLSLRLSISHSHFCFHFHFYLLCCDAARSGERKTFCFRTHVKQKETGALFVAGTQHLPCAVEGVGAQRQHSHPETTARASASSVVTETPGGVQSKFGMERQRLQASRAVAKFQMCCTISEHLTLRDVT